MIARGTLLAAVTVKSRLADACSGFLITRSVLDRTGLLGTLARDAIREVEETVRALVAHWTSVVLFAAAGSGNIIWTALSACILGCLGTCVETRARIAFGEVHEPFGAGIAQMSGVLFFALARASVVIASCVGVVARAVAFEAGFDVDNLSRWVSIEAVFATLAVDARRMMFTIDADATAFVNTFRTDGETVSFYILVVVTAVGVLVAVASNAFIFVVALGVLPFPLVKKGHAFLARNSGSVVFAVASQFVVARVLVRGALVSVPVAVASPADGNILDRVKISPRHRLVVFHNAHQMTEQCFCKFKSKPNLSRFRPSLESGTRPEVDGARATFDERNDDFSVLEWRNFRKIRSAADLVVD